MRNAILMWGIWAYNEVTQKQRNGREPNSGKKRNPFNLESGTLIRNNKHQGPKGKEGRNR